MYLAHPRALGLAEKIVYYPSPKKENYLLFTNNGTYATPIEIVRLASEYGLRMGVANVVPHVRATFNANIWQTGTDKEVNITFYSNKGGVFTVGEEGSDTFIEGDQILTRGDATVVCNAMLKCKSFFRNDKGTLKLCSSRNGTYGVLEHQQGTISLHAEHAVNPACVYRIGKDSELWEGSHHSELNLNGFDMEVAALIEDDIGKGGWRKIRAGDAPATLTVGSDTQDSSFGSHSRYGDGTLSGALSIVKKGAAAFDLNGTNSFTGSVTVHGGVLNARAKNALGQGTLIEMKGGTLALFDSESASTNATLRLASLDGSKGMLSLADGVEQKIQYIEVGGVIGPEGTYGSLTSQAAHKHPCFAGNGILHVLRGRSGLVITLK
jgi:autotransporter-associated beta strand protein